MIEAGLALLFSFVALRARRSASSRKEEIEIEQSDTVLACLLRDRRIGFGTIKFPSF